MPAPGMVLFEIPSLWCNATTLLHTPKDRKFIHVTSQPCPRIDPHPRVSSVDVDVCAGWMDSCVPGRAGTGTKEDELRMRGNAVQSVVVG